MPPATKIPATIVTGFLGAGKTTLIRHLVAASRGRRLALLINEFGDVGIDKAIVEGCDDAACDEIIELANGCICCTVAEDFLPAMQMLLARPEPPDHILIETSGLALPKPLIQAFLWPDVRTRVTVDGVIAVVDGSAVAAGRFTPENGGAASPQPVAHDDPIEELFEDQLMAADLVLLSKSDLLSAPERAAAEARIRAELRPGVKIVNVTQGRIAPEILLGLAVAAESDLAARPSHHDNEEDHDHDEFESFTLSLDEVAAPEALAERIRSAAGRHDILRVKGFVAVAGKAMRLVLQGVGTRVQHYYDRDWRPDESRQSRLVVIGRAGLDQAAIRAAIGAASDPLATLA